MQTSNEKSSKDTYVSGPCPGYMNKKLMYRFLVALVFMSACVPTNIMTVIYLFRAKSNDAGETLIFKQHQNDSLQMANKSSTPLAHISFEENNQVWLSDLIYTISILFYRYRYIYIANLSIPFRPVYRQIWRIPHFRQQRLIKALRIPNWDPLIPPLAMRILMSTRTFEKKQDSG